MRKGKKSAGRTADVAGIPAGFAAIEGVRFPDNHDFREKPELRGVVTEIKAIPGRGGKARRILYVADNAGELHAVWENNMLAKLFAQARVKDEIYIRFTHKEGDGGKKKVEEFVTAIKENR